MTERKPPEKPPESVDLLALSIRRVYKERIEGRDIEPCESDTETTEKQRPSPQ